MTSTSAVENAGFGPAHNSPSLDASVPVTGKHSKHRQLTGATNATACPQKPGIQSDEAVPVASCPRGEIDGPTWENIDELKFVGLYEVGRKLGEGAFGAVHLGTHIPTGKKVALKFIDQRRLHETEEEGQISQRTLLEREIRIMKQLKHPNIIKLFEVVEAYPYVVLVTEKAKTDFLSIIVDEGVRTEEEARRHVAELVLAVEAMHQKGIAHRDLKVENLMINEDGALKVIDFGLSDQLHEGQEMFHTCCGSLAYSAPELLGQKAYGMSVDVWGIGVCLYVMLTAKLPFQANNLTELHANILDQSYVIPDAFSDDLKDLINKLFVFKPAKRITLDEFKAHPWLKDAIDAAHEMQQTRPETKEALVEKLEWMGFGTRSEIVKAIEAESSTQAHISYQLLLEAQLHGNAHKHSKGPSLTPKPTNQGKNSRHGSFRRSNKHCQSVSKSPRGRLMGRPRRSSSTSDLANMLAAHKDELLADFKASDQDGENSSSAQPSRSKSPLRGGHGSSSMKDTHHLSPSLHHQQQITLSPSPPTHGSGPTRSLSARRSKGKQNSLRSRPSFKTKDHSAGNSTHSIKLSSEDKRLLQLFHAVEQARLELRSYARTWCRGRESIVSDTSSTNSSSRASRAYFIGVQIQSFEDDGQELGESQEETFHIHSIVDCHAPMSRSSGSKGSTRRTASRSVRRSDRSSESGLEQLEAGRLSQAEYDEELGINTLDEMTEKMSQVFKINKALFRALRMTQDHSLIDLLQPLDWTEHGLVVDEFRPRELRAALKRVTIDVKSDLGEDAVRLITPDKAKAKANLGRSQSTANRSLKNAASYSVASTRSNHFPRSPGALQRKVSSSAVGHSGNTHHLTRHSHGSGSRSGSLRNKRPSGAKLTRRHGTLAPITPESPPSTTSGVTGDHFSFGVDAEADIHQRQTHLEGSSHNSLGISQEQTLAPSKSFTRDYSSSLKRAQTHKPSLYSAMEMPPKSPSSREQFHSTETDLRTLPHLANPPQGTRHGSGDDDSGKKLLSTFSSMKRSVSATPPSPGVMRKGGRGSTRKKRNSMTFTANFAAHTGQTNESADERALSSTSRRLTPPQSPSTLQQQPPPHGHRPARLQPLSRSRPGSPHVEAPAPLLRRSSSFSVLPRSEQDDDTQQRAHNDSPPSGHHRHESISQHPQSSSSRLHAHTSFTSRSQSHSPAQRSDSKRTRRPGKRRDPLNMSQTITPL